MFHLAVTCSAHQLPEHMEGRSKDFAKFNGGGVTYTCKEGFSFNQNDIDDTSRTVYCQPHGVLEELNPPDCTCKDFFPEKMLSVSGRENWPPSRSDFLLNEIQIPLMFISSNHYAIKSKA